MRVVVVMIVVVEVGFFFFCVSVSVGRMVKVMVDRCIVVVSI